MPPSTVMVWPVTKVSRRSDHRELVAVTAELRAELQRLRQELDRLRVENEVLHEAAEPLIKQAPAHERFAFIHRLRGRFTVKRLCRILVTDRSNYYLRTRAQARRDEREREKRELIEHITAPALVGGRKPGGWCDPGFPAAAAGTRC